MLRLLDIVYVGFPGHVEIEKVKIPKVPTLVRMDAHTIL